MQHGIYFNSKVVEYATLQKKKLFDKLAFESLPNPASTWKRRADGQIVLTAVNPAADQATEGKAKEALNKFYNTIYRIGENYKNRTGGNT